MITRAVLSRGEPCDAAVNFGAYRSLQQHRAVSLPQHGFLVQAYISDRSNAEVTQSTLIFTAVIRNHDDSRKSQHTTGNSQDDRYYQRYR